ncbi:hypothetical protein C8R45DRAFT_1078831 [Mycena sanguinolenta]|nr:hypothetical protein C8R45DRAFT_1078831 [Mycena sanguinolenta]
MALAGKDVGMWFGPIAAASALRYVLSPSPGPLLALYAKSFFVFTLPRTILAIQDEPSTWPGADDDEMLESISDPEEEVDFGVDDGEISTTSHATSSISASTFSHTHMHHGSNSTTQSTFTSNSSNSGAHSEEADTEEDSAAPVMPLPNARFDSGPPQHASTKAMGMGKGRERAVREAYAEPEEDGDGEEGLGASGEVDDIEDDWVDPVPPSPPPELAVVERQGKDEGEEQEGDAGASAGTQRALSVPGVGGGGWRGWGGVDVARGAQAKRDGVAVSGGDECGCECAQARDGGRTQSGGVRGILTAD